MIKKRSFYYAIASRVLGGAVNGALTAPYGAACGALVGYVYGKLADLPAGKVAAAWAVWSAAHTALVIFANFLVEGQSAKAYVITAIGAASTYIGITELQKRDLIGHKMIVFLAVCQTLTVLDTLSKLAASHESVV